MVTTATIPSLAIILAGIFTYLIARYVRRGWIAWALLLPACALALTIWGFAAAGTFTGVEILARVIVGAVLIPPFVAFELWWLRRRMKGRHEVVPRNDTSYTQWHGK